MSADYGKTTQVNTDTLLAKLIAGYSHKAAERWLQAKFGSFETGADWMGAAIGTKTERAGGLFFFHDAEGRFRLSLVSGKVEGRHLKFGEAKRQSFFADPAAVNNIVKRRLAGPIKTFAAVKDAFSVEQLTKEFYGKLFGWYTWAMAAETNGDIMSFDRVVA